MRDPKGEAARWLEQARRDLEAAESIFAQSLWWIACFQSQQAAEKAVKAFLYRSGERLVLGHSVAELVRQAMEYDARFEELRSSASMLDRFYIPTRYPDGLPGGIPAESYSQQDARQALEMAKEILTFVDAV